VATYIINGMRGSLAAVLAQAKLAGIDILLHFYDNREHLRIGPLADRLGWTLVHSPATRSDPSSGVAAIPVRNDSKNVSPIVASARSIVASRYITMTCKINNNTDQEFSSVYLSAQAPARKKQLHTIAKSKILMEHAIVGGDFNCVENVNLDVRYPAQGGSTYANASGQTLARLIAESGMIDSYRLVYGDAKTGYSRMAHTIHTRIDCIYTQAHNSVWRWQKDGKQFTLPPTHSQATPPLITFR
jgi:hypothetical protein